MTLQQETVEMSHRMCDVFFFDVEFVVEICRKEKQLFLENLCLILVFLIFIDKFY